MKDNFEKSQSSQEVTDAQIGSDPEDSDEKAEREKEKNKIKYNLEIKTMAEIEEMEI